MDTFESRIEQRPTTRASNSDAAFESWVGQRIIMLLAFGKFRVSLRGLLLKSCLESLLMRLDDGLEVEIPKKWLLAIEEGRCSSPSHESVLLRGLS